MLPEYQDFIVVGDEGDLFRRHRQEWEALDTRQRRERDVLDASHKEEWDRLKKLKELRKVVKDV